MDFDDLLAEMNITLGDTPNTTFTPEEKTRALTKAFSDQWVVSQVWDTTGSFDTTNYQEPVPADLTTIQAIGVKLSTSDFPEPLDSGYYDIIDGNIHWSANARYGLTNGTTLYALGTKKLTTDDTITDKAMQEYVISLGALNTLTLLGYKKANLFLKNDTTMGELIALKRELEKDVREMRGGFAKRFQDLG